MDMDDFLATAPKEGLLETDIACHSYNRAPFNHGAASQQSSVPTDKVVLSARSGNQDETGDDGSKASLSSLRISPDSLRSLSAVTSRDACPKCHASRKYYCYTCYIPLESTSGLIPRLPSLPVRIDVVKHPNELDSKSTAVHAKVICPTSVDIWTFPDVPPDLTDAVLVYPDGESVYDVGEALAGNPRLRRVLFVDATWSQARQVSRHDALAGLPRVRLPSALRTAFWRNQEGKGDDYLATIEAIYYFLREYHEVRHDGEYSGEYDPLLFLFKFFHDQIHKTYSLRKEEEKS